MMEPAGAINEKSQIADDGKAQKEVDSPQTGNKIRGGKGDMQAC